MTLILNPCEKCVVYRRQAQNYLVSICKGDYSAIGDLKTLLESAINEERNP